jgi:hypothetical protein
LTVANPAAGGFLDDADRFPLFLRQRDGLMGRVTAGMSYAGIVCMVTSSRWT